MESIDSHLPQVYKDFRVGTLREDMLDHAAHVYCAWALLRENGHPDSAHREFAARIRDYTIAWGAAAKFHATVTHALFFIMVHRVRSTNETWAEFRAANDDLFTDARALLAARYSPELLASDRARRQVMAPDLGGGR